VWAVVLVAIATVLAAAAAARVAETVPFEDIVYGERRNPAITALLDAIGRDRAAVIVYLLERSWNALVLVTALTPLFFWVLGSTAVHAAARLGGARKPFGPLFVLFGYASAAARIPADVATLAVPALAGAVGALTTLGFGAMAWHALQAHYGLAPQRAVTTLVVALVLFYIVPFAVIVGAAVAILIAAIVLEYVPPL
jgi:hypothetical protein